MSKTIVCSCEDITLDEVIMALEQGYGEIESLKRYTGIGTGKCQGKCCIVQTLRLLASEQGHDAIRRGATEGPGEPLTPLSDRHLNTMVRIPTIRQPVTPLLIDDIVAAEPTEDGA